MLMVYILGVGACVSFYFLYKNKKKISFEVLKYYTYLDEYFTTLDKSKDTHFLYPNNSSISETANLKNCLVSVFSSPLNFIITKDFLVLELEEENKQKSKTFYTIYKIQNDMEEGEKEDDEQEENRNVIKSVDKIDLGVNYQLYEEKLDGIFFSNQMNLLQNILWDSPVIAASINLVDESKIYTFREFDITDFFNGFVREDSLVELNNSNENKILWIYIFNFIFKDKHVLVPLEKDVIEKIKLSWTIVLSDCSIIEGETIKFDLKEY
tara:strand:- start:70 stop:870 length:801 start_codon:yes stop_codon:yes gene_type:complete